jgi:uncharacterized membrane protein
MYCQSCGEGITDDSNFCQHCGAQVEPERSEAAASGSEGRTVSGTSHSEATGESRPRQAESGKVAGGLDRNVAGALAYLLGFVTGLVFYLVEEDDAFVRFHAAQSMVVFGGLAVLGIAANAFGVFFSVVDGIFVAIVGFLFSLVWFLVSLGAVVLWLYLMAKAYQGETPRIPVAASIADDLV